MDTEGTGTERRVLLGLSGASGAIYGVRVLEALASQPDLEVHLIVTSSARSIIEDETGREVAEIAELADQVWDDAVMESPLASGSFPVDAMAVVPCSVSTVAKIAAGIGDTLLTRAAAVSLKERRRLVVVAREMPLSTIDLRNLTTLSEAGAVVAVASPPFYTGPETVEDMVDLVAGRVLMLMGLDPGPLLRRYVP
ncbi:MAG: UbiX family flavin prenyltransferase [Thermoplasmata archaeon]|nr:UbiX family flavin prenyltransferase [Thermoplasmata archaeon]NIS11775.1 UbiX family flavin prenyltransferase [Thermoplasmata archaeon]NIS18439.1 UbiX family flavin prenyltransferase [Thermoplasmata archaeon]NIT75428.1 UbiX family flavin prenyltransferase [Thermoplasmata archaeon]NIU47595.1 UbiX family flavin prenyltransferase [Thermoplasmata archaeon]